MDEATKKWIRGEHDERAAHDGCVFREELAEHVVQFFRKFLRHSKGEWAGKPFELLDWQREDVIYPLFGWVRPDGFRRFSRAYIELPKKNGKSTVASGIGLYMLIGDNEAGAEVYSCAADRDQASIVHNEAINMAESSPALAKVLKVNRTTRNIHHAASRSYYRAISSEAAGKEGLNIHCAIIDELHVWYGRELWNALRYGFVARRQPLLFAITTAGDDMQSVCREQHDYADGVCKGTIKDNSYFGYIRAAGPKDDWTTIETAKKANPSLGVTIREEEFQQAIDEAKQSPSNESSFKRYRLNIWSTSEHPWLHMNDWAECLEEFTEADLLGRECFAGLDLGRTRDTSSIVLIFPLEAPYAAILPYFFLPEKVAHKQKHLISWLPWATKGLIELTPGDECDYSFVQDKLRILRDRFVIKELAFDPMYATPLKQRMIDEDGWAEEELVPFAQTMTNFAGPTAKFERMVVAHTLRHNGHEVMTWQVGNALVMTDVNKNIRPVKRTKDDHRKIDGVVAGIMGMARWMVYQMQTSVYDQEGSLAL